MFPYKKARNIVSKYVINCNYKKEKFFGTAFLKKNLFILVTFSTGLI